MLLYAVNELGSVVLANESGKITLTYEEAERLQQILSQPRTHKVKALRQAAGISQSDLARRVGTSHNAISVIEANPSRKIGAPLKARLAQALGCTPEQIQ